MITIMAAFAPAFLAGFLVNLEIAAGAMLIGLAIGGALAVAASNIGWLNRPVSILVQLLLCLPGYVVMFFLVNMAGSGHGVFVVILAQTVFTTAYCNEIAKHGLRDLLSGDRRRAGLFIPNAIRGFTITTMSSGVAAAVGIPEAVGVTMHQAEHLPEFQDRIVLFLCVIGFFAVFFGLVKAASARMTARLAG
jgi:ABC-type proline/glycine betaine transport system permease subunit